MIYLFSGTGNTRKVASRIAEITGDKIADMLGAPVPLSPDEAVGFMFPVYYWGLPTVVDKFIKYLPKDYLKGRYVWGISTCGDEAGMAMRRFRRLTGAEFCATVIMPNTYVLLPGFEVDTPELAQQKLAAYPERVDELARLIKERKRGFYDVTEGSVPRLRSAAWPVYKHWGRSLARWRVNDDCISCGLCSQVCPVGNITMEEGRPQFATRCVSCCACFHACPHHAINTSRTENKKQYREEI